MFQIQITPELGTPLANPALSWKEAETQLEILVHNATNPNNGLTPIKCSITVDFGDNLAWDCLIFFRHINMKGKPLNLREKIYSHLRYISGIEKPNWMKPNIYEDFKKHMQENGKHGLALKILETHFSI